MFSKFTERARQVLNLAQEEAARLGHNYVGTEHLLLGLLLEAEGIAAQVLNGMGVDVDTARAQIGELLGHYGIINMQMQGNVSPKPGKQQTQQPPQPKNRAAHWRC